MLWSVRSIIDNSQIYNYLHTKFPNFFPPGQTDFGKKICKALFLATHLTKMNTNIPIRNASFFRERLRIIILRSNINSE